MDEKILAGLFAAAVVAPLCAVCIIGPAFLGSAIAWVTGWFTGLDPLATASLAIVAGIAVYGLVRWRRTRASTAGHVADPAPQTVDGETR